MLRFRPRIGILPSRVFVRASLTRPFATQAPTPASGDKATVEPAVTPDRTAFPATSAFENELSRGPQAAFMNDPEYEDLTRSHKGLSFEPFPPEISEILLAPIKEADIEITPDGLLYLPEIKYRRILNRAFGPGGWGLIPRGPHTVTNKTISREYALFCLGRFVAQARGEQDYFSDDKLPTCAEGAKSNALMRCCKDLGIASELWDPIFIEQFKASHCVQLPTVSGYSNTRKLLWRRKDRKFGPGVREDTGSSSNSGGNAYRKN
ncbi:uncharacterized protein SPPG_04228 [Spizellomyces punctatus DAOM BR117]|uniref:Mitochondrial genome maintenance protein MGM101 n=1 Tax=Spizellomyces punctatus (strain DAOM BR117) TaxID=645134 RepID=A0A0L0HJ62_SPIPD|nr:uncharacterized protein SPPG_04228 [Spizellomyces punctatus DAOM BR117]KND01137.1 hypothetical protein SPPG_04228 [Spizellomyces punctatus DAOM BR117]|eukprot:XP_016609176.1 hypothetical protein SPPG_04228 [Spizellomyces punctatus DAOM BR117]